MVRPPLTVNRRMRIAIEIRILMMNAVRRYPENRSTLKRQRGADGQKILHPLISFEAAMSQQTVVSHANPQTARNPPQENCHEQCFPGKEEKCSDGAHMKRAHKDRRNPVNFGFGCLILAQIL